MKISPLDIHQKQFQTTWRGFHAEEVRTFLDMVQSEMESLIRENAQLKDVLRKIELKLEEYQERETAVKDTLVMAQKVTEEIKGGALKEAEIVLSEARLRSEQIIGHAQNRLMQVRDEILDLKHQRSQLFASLYATIETHSKLLEITERQFDERDSADDGPRPNEPSRYTTEHGH